MEKSKILIVDDIEANRNVLKYMILSLGHIPILAENGLLAMAHIEDQDKDLVLLDVLMPEMDGYEVLEYMKSNSNYRHIPVIMISALEDKEGVVKCIERGADDYLFKPFDHTLLKARISACLEKKQLQDMKIKYCRQTENFNIELQDRVWDQVNEITAAQRAIIFAMAKLAESRDPETGEHLLRMKEYAKVLSEKLRLLPKYASAIDDNYVDNIHAASPLHDIGKVGIPDSILLKPGKLTNEEFDIIEAHTTIGAKTLKEVDEKHPGNDLVRFGIEIAENHHEKWDGNGYPNDLTGENIPLAGRIVALGDVYDALTSKRCYKDAFSHTRSREIILAGCGKHFDPDIVDAFVSSEDEFISIRESYVDTESEAMS